eukprot:3214784-Pyramimonas_sp.AAC.1
MLPKVGMSPIFLLVFAIYFGVATKLAFARGFHSFVFRCCLDTHVRIAVEGADNAPFLRYDPLNIETPFSGLIYNLIDDIFLELGATFEIIPLNSSLVARSYVLLLEAMEAGEYDMAIDFAWTTKAFLPINTGGSGLGHELVFSIPFYQSEIGGMLLKTKSPEGLWSFTQSFTAGMWGSVVLAICGFAISIVMVEHLHHCSRKDLFGGAHSGLPLSSWVSYARAMAQS